MSFQGKSKSYEGFRGQDNTKGWNTVQFGHDKLKYHQRGELKESSGKDLRVAARDGNYSRIKDLVRAGADVNQQGGSHKHTALHYASRFGHLECMEALLKVKADPNISNIDGRTALHWAAANGTAAACDLLVRAGAKPGARNKDGMTSLELANHFNNAQVIPILRQSCGLGKEENPVSAERIGVWGGKDVPQAPAGAKHNKHFGRDEVSVQRVGVWHNSWAHYDTVVTPNDRRHRYNEKGERYNHGIH
mmetsp:Transcript_2423/g.4898  ORF Transcript_2423/g.4898 Transcript_2423/m.4898 type:complete len:248 (-) Transcript_2423:146-889(-)